MKVSFLISLGQGVKLCILFLMYLRILVVDRVLYMTFVEITDGIFSPLLQSPRFVDPLHLSAMACPALPLCPLAIAEAERGAPDILQRIRDMFERVSFVCHPLGSWCEYGLISFNAMISI